MAPDPPAPPDTLIFQLTDHYPSQQTAHKNNFTGILSHNSIIVCIQ